jgi:hypothetical protein
VTITASVAPPGATGTITFFVDGVAQTPVTLDSNGKATLTTNKLKIGPHKISATYSGDANFNGSSASFTQTIYRNVGRRL